MCTVKAQRNSHVLFAVVWWITMIREHTERINARHTMQFDNETDWIHITQNVDLRWNKKWI